MLPNVTKLDTQPSVRSTNEGALDAYITYCALGGLITEDDGKPSKMKLDDFCATYGVTRMTLSRWKREIPDFVQRVDKRRTEIVPLARVSAVWNANFVAAVQTKDLRAAVEAQKVFLGHFGNLVTPTQRVDATVQVNTWTGLMEAKRTVIEGEVVDGTPAAA